MFSRERVASDRANPFALESASPLEARRIEASYRRNVRARDNAEGDASDIKFKLGIERRWTPGSAEWEAKATKMQVRTYQLAVDKLESLVVARMFELTKVNMSGTGKWFYSLFYFIYACT